MQDKDLILVSDFGHGMLSPSTIKILCESSDYLSVHPQANAANFGFHSISKYPNANYVCLAQREVEIERRERGPIHPAMSNPSPRELTPKPWPSPLARLAVSVMIKNNNFSKPPVWQLKSATELVPATLFLQSHRFVPI